MRVGTFLPTYWTDYGETDVATAVRETAVVAASLGYTSLWANDHVIGPSSHASMGHIIEPLTTLASLIHLVPTMQFGTSTLVLPQRHPMIVAKQVAALDVLSGGRFTLGVGVGWLEAEFQLLGADFAQRGAVTDEAIGVMRALWSEPTATFHGRYYDFSDAVSFPKPQGGSVPLWICGNTGAAIRRAAQFGDAWDPFCLPLQDFEAGITTLRTLAQELGRPTPTIAAHMQICLGDSNGPERPLVAGSEEEVATTLQGYCDAGLEYLICDFVAGGLADLLGQMRVMAEQIVPSLKPANNE